MKFKDYEPIKFEIFQSDMERIMYQLNNIINGKFDMEQVKRIREDFQQKISIHYKRGEWK